MNAPVHHQTLVTPAHPKALASGQFKVTARDVVDVDHEVERR